MDVFWWLMTQALINLYITLHMNDHSCYAPHYVIYALQHMLYNPMHSCLLQSATRGLDAVDEMDPLEQLRRRHGLDTASAATEKRVSKSTPIPSLEDELRKVHNSINIKDFDYLPVPRSPDEES